MQDYSVSPRAIAASLWRHRELLWALIVRDVVSRYRGSLMGILWSLFNPVFMLLVYTFVFSVVFNARWGGAGDSKMEFALVLFAGLMVFNLFAECVGKAPGLILNNVGYVKRVVFPLEILPVAAVGAALFNFFVSLAVWLVAYIVFMGSPHPTVAWFPVVLLPLVLLLLGLSWALASVGVYVRDVMQFIGVVITVMMFLSPIFYPASALPQDYAYLLTLNPLAPAIDMMRGALYWGRPPEPIPYAVYTAVAALVAWLGFAWFQLTRKGFADVL